MRKKLAVPVLVVSFLCMIATAIHNYGFAGAADIIGGTGVIVSVVVVVISIALIMYARSMAKKGVLA